MKEYIEEVYMFGLEKYAGDKQKAKEFTTGFMKEAAFGDLAGKTARTLGSFIGEGAGKAIGTGAVGLGLGLGVYGLSSALNSVNNGFLRDKFEKSLSDVMTSNPILANADPEKVRSYAETIFKYVPRLAADKNLLSSVLANAVYGEGLDPMTIRTLADLEGRIQESRKSSLFSPKSFI